MSGAIKISNPASFQVMHTLRGRCDAILVGIDTVLKDDPMLTVRPPRRMPLRVVIDRESRLPQNSRLAQTAHQTPLHVYTAQNSPLDESGHLSLTAILADLHHRGITHLLVEPGPRLAAAFLTQNLADRVWLFRSSHRVNDDTAPTAIPVPFPPTASIELEGDLLTEHLNPQSDVFFCHFTSSDFPKSS